MDFCRQVCAVALGVNGRAVELVASADAGPPSLVVREVPGGVAWELRVSLLAAMVNGGFTAPGRR